jgi:Family of unknown function (DUF6188)
VFEVGRALPLFNQRVVALRAESSGELFIDFDSGTSIRVPVNPHYENWELNVPAGGQLIGLPGGGVTYCTPS